MKRYIILICCALVLCVISSKLIDLITVLRIRRGLTKKLKIIIQDSETIIFNSSGNELFREPNDVLYIGNNGKKNKVLMFGNSGKNEILRKFKKYSLCQRNFIKEVDDVINEVSYFCYQYITYYVLKSKKKLGMSAFPIVSVSLNIDVTSTLIKEKLKLEFEKAIPTKSQMFYNLIEIN
jgi:hypothetical protein